MTTALVKDLETKCNVAFKTKKAVIIKAAMALGNYQIGDKPLNDGLLRLGSYSEDNDLVFEGDVKDLVIFKGDFAVTACCRSFNNEGMVTLMVRDDRPGKNVSKILLYNSDQDVSKFLHYLSDNLKLKIEADVADLDEKIKAAFKCKKQAITKLAMAVANYKCSDGSTIGDNMFLMTDYDPEEEAKAIGDVKDLFKFKNDFVVTACQRVVDGAGMASLIIRDDRPGKNRSKQLLFNGDTEVISFIKFMETVLGIKL